MILLHTSDWHLGAYIKGFSLQEDQEYLFEQLFRILEERRVDAMLVAGDVYDTVTSRAEAISLYDRVMTRICGRMNIPAVVIAGNHDGAERLAAGAELLSRAGLHVFGRIRLPIQPVLLGAEKQVTVYPVPFFHPDEVREYLQATGKGDPAAIRTPEDALAAVIGEIRPTLNPKKFNVLMGHVTVLDVERSASERSVAIGMVDSVPASLMDGFDYVALGHIHKPQQVGGRERIRYSGSMQIMSFGAEEKQTKSVVLVDTETGAMEQVPLRMKRPFHTVEGSLAEIQAQLPSCREDYLELHVTDQIPPPEVQSALRNDYPYITSIQGRQEQAPTCLGRVNQQEAAGLSEEDLLNIFLEDNGMEPPTPLQLEFFRAAWKAVRAQEDQQ